MKKNNLLKAILIVFAIFVALSWIIPAGYYDNGSYTSVGTAPIGFFDLILYPLATFTSSVFLLIAINFLLIGALYGVLKKTGAYAKLLDTLTKKFKGHEKLVLGITVCAFSLLASLTSLVIPLFIFVPFMAALLMLLGYDKITAMLSTVGAILVGNMASLYGANVAGYIANLTEKINASIGIRIVFFLISTIALIFILLKNSSLKKANIEEIPFYEKSSKKSSFKAIIILMIIGIVCLIIGMFDWSNVFGIELFNNFHEKITDLKIGEYPLISNLIGSVPAIGSWNNYEVGLILIILMFIIGKVYKLKLNDIIDGAKEGMKVMLPVAFFTIIANIVFLLMNIDSNGYTFFSSINNAFVGEKFNVLGFSATSLLGSFLYNDFPYFFSYIYSSIVNFSDKYVLIGLITQFIHGLVQLVAPTSIILVAGLTYFKIPYTEYLKKIWKLLLCLFIIVIVMIIISAIII